MLISGFNTTALRHLVGLLSPSTMVVKLTSSSATEHLSTDHQRQVDPWYGTLYKHVALAPDFIQACHDVHIDAALKLPSRTNPYLTDDLSLVAPPTPPPMDAPPPTSAYASTAAKLWYRLDTSFGVPYASASVSLTLPPVSASASGAALTALYVSLLREQLKPQLNDATAAQLSLSVAGGSTSIGLSAYGLSPKLPTLVSAASRALTSTQLAVGRFAAHKQLLADSLANDVLTPKPTDYAKSLFSELTLKHYFSSNATLRALQALERSHLLSFSQSLFDSAYVEMMVMGNLGKAAATSLMDTVERAVVKKALPAAQRAEQGRVNLRGANWLLAARHPNPQETNGAVRLVVQLGKVDAADAARAQVLSELVSQPFFYELRTVQQLGYSAPRPARPSTLRARRWPPRSARTTAPHVPRTLLARRGRRMSLRRASYSLLQASCSLLQPPTASSPRTRAHDPHAPSPPPRARQSCSRRSPRTAASLISSSSCRAPRRPRR